MLWFSRFWPDIDNHIKRLAIDKGIRIRLMVSHWSHSPAAMRPFLKSLADISRVYPHVDIQVVSELLLFCRLLARCRYSKRLAASFVCLSFFF